MFYLPTKIFLERNCIKNHQKELQALGNKALIVTGRNSARLSGALSDIESACRALGVETLHFDKVEENPSTVTCKKAAEMARSFKPDFVIAIGGGSPIDAAKAISLLLANPQLETDSFYHYDGPVLHHLPIAAVPTTAGTGAEVTPNAVLTDPTNNTKSSIAHSMYPCLALLDPGYLVSMNSSTRIFTAVDSLSHLLESFFSTKSPAEYNTAAKEGLTLWKQISSFLSAEHTPSPEEYEVLLRASLIAGIAIAQTGTSIPHALGYSLTCELGLPHGHACGITLGGYVSVLESHGVSDVSHALSLLGFQEASALADYLKTLLPETEIPETLKKDTVEGLLINKKKLSTCPVNLTREELLGMYL